jgi:tetratricopeptide (TPR) repeat protein
LDGLSVTDVAIILRETADVYLALNLYEEARTGYDDSVRRLREAGARRHLGGALWGMGAWALATGDHAVARQSLAEAVEIFVESDNAISLSGVLLERASLHLTTGDQEAAQADAAQALALVSGADLAAPQAFAHLRMAEALWHAPERAEPHLKQAQFLSGSVGLPHLLFRCQLRAGQLRRRQRRLAEARQSLEEAVNQVERLRGRIPQEAVRASFMGDKAEAYEAWVALLLEMGESDKAFEAAEHAKSRTLVDALNMGGRAKLSAEMSAGQAIHGELMAVYNRLLGSDPSVQSPGMKEQLHKRARDLEAQLQSIAIEFPGRSASGIGADRSGLAPLSAPLPWEKICALLPNGVTLVEYFCAGEEVMAFVGHRGALEVRPQLCKLSQVRALSDRLAVQLQRCETPRRKDPAVQAGLMASCRRVLTELYALLVEPLRPHMEAVRSPEGLGLVVVPHGLLHRLPFHAFCDSDGRYLIDDYEISYAPSATVFGLCAQLEHRSLERAVLVGSHTDVLPSIGLEIDTLRGLMSESVVLRDAGATIDAVRQSGVGHDLLHFASHAIYRTDNPLYSALQLADGWLTAADLLSMPLNGAMVTLSACESGRAHIRGGDELIGFSRAALAAGASTVVVSGWRVDDASTARLMEAFYTQLLAGKGRAAALRSAQLALRSEHPHPWHWAPFSLSGQR